MAIVITSNSGKTHYALRQYVCDTNADIVDLPIDNIWVGSTAFVIESGETYMLNSTLNWVKVDLGSGGGGGSSEDLQTVAENFAPAYDETQTYSVGDLVVYQYILYKCITAISTPEEFDDTKWEYTTLESSFEIDDSDTSAVKTWSSSKINTQIGSVATYYGTCTDLNSTVAKTATLVDAPDFSLYTGVTIRIKFTNFNNATNPTLDVNSTGAKAIKRVGTTAIGTSVQGSWADGAIVTLTYDGTNWVLNGSNDYVVATSAYAHAEGFSTTASGSSSHAEGYNTYADGVGSHAEGCAHSINYKHQASADGSHVEGYGERIRESSSDPYTYIYNTASGKGSHAEGCGTTASGKGSHAEGSQSGAGGGTISYTVASGIGAHAEGGGTMATGNYSHSEGERTFATGNYSHTEGSNTRADSYGSHAEGSGSRAMGSSAHAEGWSTYAIGTGSHSEGSYTSADYRSQHVFGEYNIVDPSTETNHDLRGTYVEIVGNGDYPNARSNARTLDWSGNETLAGKLTVGAAPTNNMDVATKQYVDGLWNTFCVELTQEEYNNLSDIQKNNGTLYFITDVTGGDPIVHPTIYSENEREIGVWTDGKPLYEKTIAITNEKFGNAMTLNTGVSDMENLVYSEWCITGNLNVTPPVEASGTYIRCEHTGNGVLTIGISDKQFAANENRTWYLTIRYTKIADTAGSGTWTPQGVPSYHYSTDEQVIGTWVDGSTIYEKTISIGSMPNNTIKSVAHGISNLDMVIDIFGIAYSSTLNAHIPLPYMNTAGMIYCIGIYVSDTDININTITDMSSYGNSYITIQYTKSTT